MSNAPLMFNISIYIKYTILIKLFFLFYFLYQENIPFLKLQNCCHTGVGLVGLLPDRPLSLKFQ